MFSYWQCGVQQEDGGPDGRRVMESSRRMDITKGIDKLLLMGGCIF